MDIECNDCGFLISEYEKTCPKCQMAVKNIVQQEKFYEIDIAHNGQTWERARKEFLQAIEYCQKYRYKSLRIIHGYGSNTGNSSIKEYVLSMLKMYKQKYGWKYRQCENNQGSHTINFR